MWKLYPPKFRHETLRMDFKNGQLKNVDIFFKITSLLPQSFVNWRSLFSCITNEFLCYNSYIKIIHNVVFFEKIF